MVELPDLARRLLDGKNFATVATVMSDGRPQASVVWIHTDGPHIVFNTAEGRVKPRNMRRDARVAIAVFDMENPYQQAMIQGRVVAMEHEGAEESIDAMTKKYMDLDSYPHRREGEQRVIVRIAPEKIALME
ncbi:MAG: PPOX class F420-dependent oxidoreductase [Rhodospirillales bacterium]|nr:PPOX class F420-dependent oxidoreductase [Rhodospirillales bacterium]MDE0379473.1 PPOX class F420-dependent oxidoreductase [Rhodospirillales bacterium]